MKDKKPTVIDIHAHVAVPEFYDEALPHSVFTGFGAVAGPKVGRGSIMAVTTEQDAQLEEMDKRGIDINVVMLITVVQPTYWGDAKRDAELCRIANDWVADWVARRPNRFCGCFTLPLSDRDAALKELDRCVGQLGMPMVQVPSAIDGKYLGEPEFHYLWEALDDQGVAAFMHPTGVRDPWFQKFRMWNSIGQSIEEAKFITSMIYEGVLERHPGLKLIIAHGGGFLPHYMGRLDRNVANMPDTMKNITKKPSDYLRQLYFDTCVYDTRTLEALIDRVGANHLIFGSDYPIGDADPVAVVSSTRGLDGAALERVLGGNARMLLGMG